MFSHSSDLVSVSSMEIIATAYLLLFFDVRFLAGAFFTLRFLLTFALALVLRFFDVRTFALRPRLRAFVTRLVLRVYLRVTGLRAV